MPCPRATRRGSIRSAQPAGRNRAGSHRGFHDEALLLLFLPRPSFSELDQKSTRNNSCARREKPACCVMVPKVAVPKLAAGPLRNFGLLVRFRIPTLSWALTVLVTGRAFANTRS